jgi:glycosyltransferase involved in cell wall biosynthesis
MSRKKILWLPGWYPNKLSPFNGDFIKRHAEAVSLYDDIQVIYVVRDVNGVVTKSVYIEESEKNGLAEKIIYYYSTPRFFSIRDKYLSETRYRKIYKQTVIDYINKSGVPSLSHVHVTMKAGIIAQWLKRKKAVPYIITEHWTGLLPEANEKISNQPFYLRSLWKKVIKGACAFSAVSAYLAAAVQKRFGLPKVHIIPNVVDTSIFYPSAIIGNNQRFIHISGLDEFKNPAGIIEAFGIVQKTYPLVTLDIFGPPNKLLTMQVNKLGLEKNIQFNNEIPQQQLADYVRQSLALILYSAYETFGCVIIEANACGIPVIVSNIPVFHETVTEGVNGIFAEANNPAALAKKMIELIESPTLFNSKTIAAESSKYSYENVGRQFSDWYREVLSAT